MSPNKREITYLEEALQDPAFQSEFAAAELKSRVGSLLHDAFNSSGLTQTDFGNRIGVSRARANQIVLGDAANLTLGVMGRCAGALGLTWKLALADILSGEVMHELYESPVFTTSVADEAWASVDEWMKSGPEIYTTTFSFSIPPNVAKWHLVPAHPPNSLRIA